VEFKDWRDETKYLRGQGVQLKDIVDQISKKYFPELSLVAVKSRVKRIIYKKHEGLNDEAHVALQNFTPKVVNSKWEGSSRITFGVVSDTHLNNQCTQLTYLHQFYDLAKSRGIKDIYHCGDIDDGEQMRVGHVYECYNQGGDAHIRHICNAYPRREGITTHFITGNHDASIWKKCGINIGEQIALRRSDMDYLGSDIALVNLTPNCKMELRHPWDGNAYALSYRPQKLVESLTDDDMPDILCIGHYHKQGYFWYKNVHTILAACFCSQTPFMKGKGLSAAIGGWIIDIIVDSKGHLLSISPEFIPFKKSITDDYKHYS